MCLCDIGEIKKELTFISLIITCLRAFFFILKRIDLDCCDLWTGFDRLDLDEREAL